MTERSREDITNNIQELLTEYMTVDADSTVLCTGFVLQAKGVMAERSDVTRGMWMVADGQDIFTTLGLTTALSDSVSNYFFEVDPEDDDGD